MTTDAGRNHWRSGCACCAGATLATRRGFLAGTAALGAASGSGFLASFTGASAQGAVAPRGGEFVIRGGYVITMDKAAGDIPVGDVHVRNGAIVGVAPSISAPGAETIDAQDMIVMPGFIETHSHCWNALLKNMRRPGVDYFPLKEAFGKHHTPTDYYRAVRLFMTDALNAGITTVINYAHNTQSPAHVDAEIRAMMESGLRGRYAYSGPDPYPNDKTIDFDDVLRAKRTFFSRPDNLIDLGYGLRPSTPLSAPLTAYPQEFRFAIDNGLPIILHSGSRPGVMNPAKLQAEGFSKNMIFVHSLMFDQKDREVMARDRNIELVLALQRPAQPIAGRAARADPRHGAPRRQRLPVARRDIAQSHLDVRPDAARLAYRHRRAGHAAGENAAHPDPMPGDGHHQRRQGHGHRRQDRLAGIRQARRYHPAARQ